MHWRIGPPCPPDLWHSRSQISRGSFKFVTDYYTKSNGAHFSSTHLIRWRSFEFSEGSSRNWRDTSVLVLSRTCGGTMKVIIMVPRSRTSRVAKVHIGLMCPVKHIEWISLKVCNDDESHPKLGWDKAESVRYSESSMTLTSFKLKEACSCVNVQICDRWVLCIFHRCVSENMAILRYREQFDCY